MEFARRNYSYITDFCKLSMHFFHLIVGRSRRSSIFRCCHGHWPFGFGFRGSRSQPIHGTAAWKYHEISWYWIIVAIICIYIYYTYIPLKIPHYDTQKIEYFWQRQFLKRKGLFHGSIFRVACSCWKVKLSWSQHVSIISYNSEFVFFPPSVSKVYVCFFAFLIEALLINRHLIPRVNSCSARPFDPAGWQARPREGNHRSGGNSAGWGKKTYSLSNISDPGKIIM